GGVMDRLAVYVVERHVLSEGRVVGAVRHTKAALFPDGYPGPARTTPTAEEQRAMEDDVIAEIERHVPCVTHETVVTALDPLSSEACNAHLGLFVFDLVMLTLFPELGGGV
ncbi:hypothetical protein EW145_g8592, partial [Phellinidium pouzarii]